MTKKKGFSYVGINFCIINHFNLFYCRIYHHLLLVQFHKNEKAKKYFADLHTGLAEGQKVQLSNGIFGTVRTVGKETVDIEIKSGAIMEVSRYAISQIMV